MHKLPKKFASITLALTLLFPLLFFITKSAYAKTFFETPKEIIEELEQADKLESEDGQARVFSTPVKNREITDLLTTFSGHIVCLSDNPNICKDDQTAMGMVINLIAMTYTHPPASGYAFVHDTLANAGLVKPAYAQGIGFAGLAPLLPLWKTVRNIAYMAVVIVMLAIGFMIIFRMKIDPKTVISVQAALPRIVVALILITFSYAIVGFLIDIMYLVMAVIISIIGSNMGLSSSEIAEFQNIHITGGITTLGGFIFSGGANSARDFLTLFFKGGLFGLGGAGLLGGLWNFLKLNYISAIVGFVLPSVIFLFILVLGLLFTFIRLLLLLINSYIQLLISLILGPIILLTEAIPGRAAFKSWILNVMANLSVFPTTVAILMFALFLSNANINSPLWVPPFIGFPGGFAAFLGIAIIFITPVLVAKVKKIFKPQPLLPISAGTAISPLSGALQTTMGVGSQFYYSASLIDMYKRFRGEGGGGGGR